MPLTAPNLTLDIYREVLQLLLPVLQSWEDWAARFAPAAVRPLLPVRRRSHWIEQDLLSLGEPSPLAARSNARPIPWSEVVSGAALGRDGQTSEGAFEAAFLGALYVMEGSTLGGRFIARHVEQVLGLAPGRGDAYFRGHEEQTGAVWRETTAVIAAVPEANAEIVIDAARRTFLAFGTVLGTMQPAVGLLAGNGGPQRDA